MTSLIGNLTIGPRLGLNWTDTHIDDYAEKDGGPASPNGAGGGAAGLRLHYDDQWVNSLQSVVGLQGSVAISTGLGVFAPQFNADYIHEFANSQRSVTVNFVEDLRQNPSKFRFQTEKPFKNFFNLSTGVVALLAHGIQPFVNFRVMVGNEQFNNYAGFFDVRIEMKSFLGADWHNCPLGPFFAPFLFDQKERLYFLFP